MRCEIDRLRAAKKELEARQAGVDLAQMQREYADVRQAEARLREAQLAHQRESASLRSKLAWYVENQQLLDEVEEQLTAAAARAAQLEGCLAAVGVAPPPPPPPPGTTMPPGADVATALVAAPAARVDALTERERERLRSLEEQVTQLQSLLARRAGGGGGGAGGARGRGSGGRRASVGELIAAAGPSPEQEAKHVAMQQQLEQLEAQHDTAEKASQRRMRSLRQQHERVVAAHEAKAAALEAQLKQAKAEGGGAGGGAGGRTRRELERQVEEVRATLGKRVRELESKLAEAERGASKRAAAAAADKDKERPTTATRAGRPAMLACHRGAAFRSGGTAPSKAAGGGADSTAAGQQQSQAQTADAAASGAEGRADEGVERGHDEANGAAETMEAVEAAEAAAFVELTEARAALERVGELAASLGTGLDNVAASPPSSPWLLESAAGWVDGGNGGPQAQQLAMLQAHVASLERRLHARSLDAQELVERARRLGGEEARIARREYDAALQRKNAQIEAFRVDLDAILGELAQLHARQAEAVAAGVAVA